jgi:hypothetical protein
VIEAQAFVIVFVVCAQQKERAPSDKVYDKLHMVNRSTFIAWPKQKQSAPTCDAVISNAATSNTLI